MKENSVNEASMKKKNKESGPVYCIEYSYQTGDSFHTEDRRDTLEYEWHDYDIAKEALTRINEHYKWYEGKERSYAPKVKKPKWHKINTESMKWFHEDSMHNLINLRMDDGQEVQFWPPWCGYFESLYGAEIVLKHDKFRY
jgi:hypothetical protein